MNAKKYIVAAIVLNTVLLAFAASYWHQHSCETQSGANDPTRTALIAPSGKFSPVIETILPGGKGEGPTELLDLETGRRLTQPPLEFFNSRAETIMAWIRSNGLDISCFVWSSGAACISYDMIIVPVDGKCWEETTEQELLNNPVLAPVRHSRRRLLVLGQNRPDTYIFRTAEGTLGMLRIVGVNEHQRGVNICYKLISPAKSIAATRLSGSQRAVVSR